MTNIENLGNKEIFAKNLNFYLKEYNKDAAQVCKELNIPASTFSDWQNAKKYPRIDKIELIANYFGIQKSNLIENNEELSDIDKQLFSKAKELNYEEKQTVLQIMSAIHKEIDKELDK